jgi:hypothetical protein
MKDLGFGFFIPDGMLHENHIQGFRGGFTMKVTDGEFSAGKKVPRPYFWTTS